MAPKLIKIWTDTRAGTGEQTLRADFSNDRHYEVVVRRPYGAEQIARALFDMAGMIAGDPHLTPNVELGMTPGQVAIMQLSEEMKVKLGASPLTHGFDLRKTSILAAA